MKTEIVKNIDRPAELERLYRKNKSTFRREFNLIYPELEDSPLTSFWHERLNYETSDISWGTNSDLMFVVMASLLAGCLAKLPELKFVQEEFFYTRNIGFIVFPILTAYFFWKNETSVMKVIGVFFALLVALLYINILPDTNSDTLILACIHLPLVLWSVLGFSYVGNGFLDTQKRLDFLRYNGDLVVMTVLILIAGMILTGITIGLFSLIGFEIADFYFRYMVVMGLAASPIVGTYVTQTNPQLVNKVSPVIAKIFSPLVLITLVTYLIAIVFSGKDPYNDREFLMVFNALLIGVLAIILFSVAEASRTGKSKVSMVILTLLAVVTVIVNGIAISAIMFRIAEWGITPNRLAVLGGNVIILINLLVVSFRLIRTIRHSDEIESVEKSIASFLPIYSLWTVVVTFLFPLIFGFK